MMMEISSAAGGLYKKRLGLTRSAKLPSSLPTRARFPRVPQVFLSVRYNARNASARPASGSDGQDISGEELAPIVFSFADTTASSGSTGLSSSSAYPRAPLTPSKGTAGSGVLGSATSAVAPAATTAAVPTDVTPRLSSGSGSFTSNGGLNGVSVITRPSPSSDAGSSWSGPPAPDSSFSEHYRKANTPFTRTAHAEPPMPPGALNGSTHIAKSTLTAATASSSSALEPTASATSAPSDTPATDGAEVAAALARAQAALERAETSLDDMERLSSLDAATLASFRAPPTRLSRALSVLRTLATLGTLSFALLASHAFGLAVQWAGAAAGAALIAVWGLRRGALAPSGAAAAFVVGCGTLGSSLRLGATLLAFFFSSSKLTAYKEELKEGLDEHGKKGGQRSWVQVLCNGLVPTIIAVVYGILAGCVDLPLGPPIAPPAAAASAASAAATLATEAAAGAAAAVATAAPAAASAVAAGLEPWRAAACTALMGGFLGYYACCCGDTWASELGPLSRDTPRLVPSMRPVRRGTNGGVTLLGLSASIMGGMAVGLVFYLAGLLSPTLWIFEAQRAAAAAQWRLIPLGLVAGLAGSLLDSLLGATLQYSGLHRPTGRIVGAPGPDVEHISGVRILDNNAVNLLSASMTAALTAFVALKGFGF